MKKWLSPTLKRIVILIMLLALATQISLVYIGFAYTHSFDRSLHEKRAEDMRYQFQQNVLFQLNDIDNLMLLLQTPEFINFFKDLMRLREETVIKDSKRQLLDKFKALNISPSVVQGIYFIGQNFNQRSLYKPTGSDRFEELPRLDLDRLHYVGLDKLFLPDHNQFTLYSEADMEARFVTDNPMLEKPDIEQFKLFMSKLEGHPVLSSGTDNVFILIVLSNQFFRKALPNKLPDDACFSVADADGGLLWTSATENPLLAGDEPEGQEAHHVRGRFRNTEVDLFPFNMRIVYSEKSASLHPPYSKRVYQMTLLTLLTLLITFLFSYVYLRKVFKPFRLISKQIKSYTLSNDWLLRPLPEQLAGEGFQTVTIRSKLILALVIAVTIPALSDGIVYSLYSRHDIAEAMKGTVTVIGDFSKTSISNRLQFTENILNEISASQQFQEYVTEKNARPSSSDDINTMNLSMFPGLNDISYFMLLDENGDCLYSSIFSNNKDVFKTDSAYLQDRDTPYWISNYKNAFNQLSTAVVKRIGSANSETSAAYLLMVPKESMFENIDSGLINTSYAISDSAGNRVYASRLRSESAASGLQRYDSEIPATGWRLAIRFVFSDVLDKNRGYQDQFLLILSLVLLLSILAASVIASMLARPIQQLKETMTRVGSGEIGLRLDAEEQTEIGGMIRSYNHMIDQLERMMREENELIAMKTRAELDMLQAQINPHFLYNTLEVINMRSMKSGNMEVSAIVGALADLFRYSVAKGSDIVALDNELAQLDNYITIQQIRFGHSFEVEYEVPESLRSLPIARFVLQPILENAIKHGFEGWTDGGLVRISAALVGECLVLRICDNGVGMDEQMLNRLRSDMKLELGKNNREQAGIGLRNVYQRLWLIYKTNMSMGVDSSEMEGTTVTLVIPVQTQ